MLIVLNTPCSKQFLNLFFIFPQIDFFATCILFYYFKKRAKRACKNQPPFRAPLLFIHTPGFSFIKSPGTSTEWGRTREDEEENEQQLVREKLCAENNVYTEKTSATDRWTNVQAQKF